MRNADKYFLIKMFNLVKKHIYNNFWMLMKPWFSDCINFNSIPQISHAVPSCMIAKSSINVAKQICSTDYYYFHFDRKIYVNQEARFILDTSKHLDLLYEDWLYLPLHIYAFVTQLLYLVLVLCLQFAHYSKTVIRNFEKFNY